jgi:large subunit ribosomal protein L24
MASKAIRIAKQSGSFLRGGIYATLRRTIKEEDRVKSWKILKGDKVEIITGKDRGKQGYVTKVFHDQNRLVVGGLKLVKKHIRGHDSQPGSIQTIESPMDLSNVSLIDPADGLPTKVAMRYLIRDGEMQKVRISKRSGLVIEKPFSPITYRERWNIKPGPKDTLASVAHEQTYRPSMRPLPEQRKDYIPSLRESISSLPK